MKRVVRLILFSGGLVHAQNTEIGAAAGYGAAGAGDSSRFGAVAGVEACFVCRGRFAPFVEYAHMQSLGEMTNDIKSFDLFCGGVRIQGRGRIRPLFDAGFVYGVDRFGYGGTRSHGNPGAVLAGGVSVPLGKHAYIRPQVRLYGLRWHAVIWTGGSFGIRF
jgi:hypothetical protein